MTRDQVYLNFIQNLPIRTRDLRLIPLSFNLPQRLVWEKIKDKINRRERLWLIILKARREGMSTMLEGLTTARTFIEDRVHAKVIAHISKSTGEIWEIAERMVKESKLLNPLASITGKSISFGNSRLSVSTAGSEDAERGGDLTIAHLSELSSWERPNALLAILQCLPTHFDSWCFIECTAKGKTGHGELFYKEWCRAEAGESDFLPIFLPWFVMPEYRLPEMGIDDDEEYRDEEDMLRVEFKVDSEQLAWRRMMIRTFCQGDVNKFHQEYPAYPDEAFIAAGLPFFTTTQLAPFYKMVEKGRKFRIEGTKMVSDPNGYLEVFRPPTPEKEYVIGADSSFGILDEDHSKSTYEILDMETLEQVAEYEASTPPHIMARHLAVTGRYYNEALLCPEIQASGGGGGRELLVYLRSDHNYYHLHQWKHGDRMQAEHPVLVGWETTAKTRPRMIARLREVIMERSCTIHSSKLLTQLANFGENESGRLEAEQGHDDLLFAFGIALVSRSENYVAKKVVNLEEPEYDLESMGIRTISDTGRLLWNHQVKILTARGTGHPKRDYLEY